jgi:hypothetical protein
MPRLRLLLLGLVLACVAQAAPYLPPGTKPDPFVAYPGPSLALTGATLIDGSGAPPQRGMTVLIQGQRIQALGPDGQVKIPEGTQQLSLAGKTPAARLRDAA